MVAIKTMMCFITTLIPMILAEEAMYGGKYSKVEVLTDANFQKMVIDSNEMWMVEFYAPWCGHCQ